MKFRLNALALFLAFSLTAQAQTTPPPTTPQEAPPDIAGLERRYKDEQEKLRAELIKTTTDIENLKNQIKAINGSGADDLKQLVEKTNERLGKLEELNKTKTTGELSLDQLRYETGKMVLVELIKDSGKLKVATRLSSNLSSFQNTMNPVNNEQFAAAMDAIRGKVGDANKGVLQQLGGGAGLLANPYISLAFSVGSFLVSNLNKSEKASKASDVVCILDFTSRISPDLRYIDSTLRTLDTQVSSFQAGAKRGFVDYAKAVGYQGTYETYVNTLSATGADPISAQAEVFFSSVKSNVQTQASLSQGNVPPDLATVRFQIENVKAFLTDYESTLKQVDDFFSSYIILVQRNLDEAAKNPLCTSKLERTRTDLIGVVGGAKDNQTTFKEEFNVRLLAPSKRILYR